jgi:tRNA A-37 threonylcarbamoyl transferase component Bud32/WD40 repeat protein
VHPPQNEPSAEALFADFLDRLDAGEGPDFEALCRQHPGRAEALRKTHVRWQAMAAAFEQMSQDDGGSADHRPDHRPDDGADDRPGAAADSTPTSLANLSARIGAAGGRLARYALRSEIARGAMGRIVSAWDDDLRREVALKIQRGPVDDARMRRRFLEEAQIAAQLDHPGIVPVHEVGADADGRPYFAMQLVRGRDLGQILAAVKAGEPEWTRTRVLGVLLRVCEAMAFAHERGVVHRDLKPANVMVGRFGETYVMDWGLAHVRGPAAASVADAAVADAAVATVRQEIAAEAGDSALLTRCGDVLGTPAYMAPEQAAGGAAVAPALDVYSLGAILYHLLAGELPYAAHARSADDLLAAVRAGPPPPLPETVPPELRAIQERAMARAPAERYATMQDFGDDLRAFLDVRIVRAYATGPFAELRKWVARNRALATLACFFAVAVAASAVAMALLWVRADDLRRAADAGADRLRVALDRSDFTSARQALQLENSMDAATALWRAHFAGRMPLATSWALGELATKDPYIAAVPDREERWLAFAGRSDRVLLSGLDGRLQIRAVPTLAILAEIAEPGASLTTLAAIGDDLAVAGAADGRLLWFDLAERRVVRRATAHDSAVTRLVAVGGGCVSGGADGAVHWWPTRDAGPQRLFALAGSVQALAARGEGAFAGDLAGNFGGAAFDGSWRLQPRRIADAITAIAAAGDDGVLWYGDGSYQLHQFDVQGATSRRVLSTRNGVCRALVTERDGSLLIGGWWRTDRLRADGTIAPVALRPVRRVALSPDERWLVTSNKISGIGVIDLRPSDRRVFAAAEATALSADGRRLAIGKGGRATVFDLASGAVVRQFDAGSGTLLALDDVGGRLAVARPLQRLQVFDVASGARLVALDGPSVGSGQALRFRPGSGELAFVTEHLQRIDANTGERIAQHDLPAGGFAPTYSADGRFLAVLLRGRAVARVFDLVAGGFRDEDFTTSWPAALSATLTALALSPDGSQVAVGNNNGPIRIRQRDGATLAIPGNGSTVLNLQFSAWDPRLLFFASGTQGIAAWDLEAGSCCFQAVYDQSTQMEVSVDGATLSCVTPAGGVAIDLTYRDRHIAGSLPIMLERLRGEVDITPERLHELQTWAAAVLARPWPRWQ